VKAKQETGYRDDNETHRLDSLSGVTKGGGQSGGEAVVPARSRRGGVKQPRQKYLTINKHK